MVLKAEIYTLFKLKVKKKTKSFFFFFYEDLIPSTIRQENPIDKEATCVI